MSNGSLYTLIPLDDFKAVLGVDDREDRLARFCLVTSSLTIEQYCKRKLLRKKYFETVEYSGDLVIPLREYPVSEILAAFLLMRNEELEIRNEQILEPEFYRAMIGCEFNEELPFCLLLSPSVKRFSRLLGVKVIYWGGYGVNPHPCGFTPRSFCEAKTPTKAKITAASRGKPSPLCGSVEYTMPHVPVDLAAACLELASWNMNRYRGRRVGMTGNIRGAGKEESILRCQYRRMFVCFLNLTEGKLYE
jgi:hypothetical protein